MSGGATPRGMQWLVLGGKHELLIHWSVGLVQKKPVVAGP